MQPKLVIRHWFILMAVAAFLGSRTIQAEGPTLLDYKFEEYWPKRQAHDWSGCGHDGACHGTELVKGKAGNGLEFDGVDDYVECGRSERLDAMPEGTLALWVSPVAHQGGLLNRSTGINWPDQRFVLAFNTYAGKEATFGFFWADGVSKKHFQLYTDPPRLNVWTHIAVTWGRKGVRLYGNGEVVAKHRPTGAPGVAGSPLKLGWCQGLGKSYFKGIMDEVRLYDRALAADEIQRVMAGAPIFSVRPPDPKEDVNGRWLNSLVKEMLNTAVTNGKPLRSLEFVNDRIARGGWVFVETAARTGVGGKVTLLFDSDDAKPVIVHGPNSRGTLEGIRFLSRGKHRLIIRSEGDARVERVVVRSIPDMVFATFGYKSCVPAYGEYDYAFLQRHLPCITTIVSGRHTEEKIEEWMDHIKEWKAKGRRWIEDVSARRRPGTEEIYAYWSSRVGIQHPLLDGIIADEYTTSVTKRCHAAHLKAIERLLRNFPDKIFIPYCASGRYGPKWHKLFTAGLKRLGCPHAPEIYIGCDPSLVQAKRRIQETELAAALYNWRELYGLDAADQIIVLAFMCEPPETMVLHPLADFKVMKDMELHYIANEEWLRGLQGVCVYGASYASEEVLRWVGKLLRHYCVEGKSERFTNDPYVLPHIENGDFDKGLAAWTVRPAGKGTISSRRIEGLCEVEGRFPYPTLGNNCCCMKRSAGRPNKVSQKIKALQPGRTYSFRMYSADPQNWKKKADRKLGISIGLEGCDVLPEKSFHHVFRNPWHGTTELPKNKVWMNYHVIIFRPRTRDATLVISDWAGPKEPGGPIGQELIFNFVQIRPYL